MKTSHVQVQKAITKVYNHLYANSEKKTPHGISKEVGKVLHTGMYIEENTLNRPAFRFSQSEVKLLECGKANEYAAFVREKFVQMNEEWCLYPQDEVIELKDFDISYSCAQLNGIEINDKDRDVFGDALEIFRSQWAKQAGGQFFTDSLVTKLAMILLEFNPKKGDDLVDICSGTGGFLLAGVNRIRQLLEGDSGDVGIIEKEVIELAKKSIIGKEYDKEVCRIANATLGARTGDANHEFVTQGDSLESEPFSEHSSRIQFDYHSCVAGNPPFGTKITIKDTSILQNFELARVKARKDDNELSKITSRAPDILFLEQNVKLLKPGAGRMSLVVPYQILSGPQTLYIRKWLLLNTIITSIVDLPADTFQPHTGTKGALLTLKRRETPLTNLKEILEYSIFMSTPKWIGHDRRGNPVYKKSPDGLLTDEPLTDFPELEQAFGQFKKNKDCTVVHDQSFSVSSTSILDSPLLQLNAQYYKPSEFATASINKKTWSTIRLAEVVDRIYYPGRFERGYVEYYPGAVPFYGGKEIIQMVTGSNKWIRHNHPKLAELVVREGWILITRSGTTGIVSIVPEAWDGYAMSEHVIRVVPDDNKMNRHYLLAFLKTQYCQDILAKGVYGSVIDSITPEYIGNINVHVPKDSESLQRIINVTETAEVMRNRALQGSYDSVSTLNELLAH